MRTRTKIIIGALTVALALAAAVNAASARRIELSEQRFLVLFKELTFEGSSFATVICDVNLEGSFHSRTLSKVSGQLIGYITEVRVAHPCEENEGWALNGIERPTGEERVPPSTLPWHILYLRFAGTLPNITSIEVQLNNGGFLVEALGLTCLYEATRAVGLRGRITIAAEGGGRLQATTLTPTGNIGKKSGSFLCPSTGSLVGSGRLGTQSTWALVFVRLVQ